MQEVIAAIHQSNKLKVVRGMEKGAANLNAHAHLAKFPERVQYVETLANLIDAEAKILLIGETSLSDVVKIENWNYWKKYSLCK